ncbi:OmpA family protein [Gilvimarinus sp. F26214L]|uniref:OmpA family protein n=1 Tax=Gilvimarinus sp. DZF01 TaxID=3461371 RepID=UPI004046621D
MKKIVALTSIAVASTAAAEPATDNEITTGLKQGAAFTTSTIVGAVAGGPLGLFLGALGGAYVGEQIEKAEQAEITELELAEQKMQVAQLHTQLAKADEKVGELSQLALDKLEFQVLFHTGADRLTERAEGRVHALADFLQKHPDLTVRLTGYADPRGTDEYNNVLSEHRARAVEDALQELGIEAYRIQRQSFGADRSVAPKGDYEAYAMERRVDIELLSPTLADNLVQAH